MILSIIIVSYNTEHLSVATIESVLSDIRQDSPLSQHTEIIVVDNASSDHSVAAITALAKKNPQIHLIANQENLGFAGANNQGIKMATGSFVLLLNSDTLIAASQTAGSQLAKLLAEAKPHITQNVGIFSPALLNPDSTPQPHGGNFPSLLTLATHMLFLDDLPLLGQWLPSTQHTGRRSPTPNEHTQVQFQDWVGGTAMLIARPVIEAIGGLDEHIFMYTEDVEYCFRARRAGWRTALIPQVKVLHYGSASSSSTRAIVGELEGYLYFWQKHRPAWQLPLAKLLIYLGVHLRILIFGTMNRHAATETYRQAKKALFS